MFFSDYKTHIWVWGTWSWPFGVWIVRCAILLSQDKVISLYSDFIYVYWFYPSNCQLIFLKEILTLDKCVIHLILRGLVRIALIPRLQKILEFFTIKGYVNYGILRNSPQSCLPVSSPDKVSEAVQILLFQVISTLTFIYNNLFWKSFLRIPHC